MRSRDNSIAERSPRNRRNSSMDRNARNRSNSTAERKGRSGSLMVDDDGKGKGKKKTKQLKGRMPVCDELEEQLSHRSSNLSPISQFAYLSAKDNLPRLVPQPPAFPQTPVIMTDIWVRKRRKPKSPTKEIFVLHPLPPKLDSISCILTCPKKIRKGPKYDINGKVIQHSILGDVEAQPQVIRTLIPVKSAAEWCRRRHEDKLDHVIDPSPALSHWENILANRRAQRKHILETTQKTLCEDLLMSETRTYENWKSKYRNSWLENVLEHEYYKKVPDDLMAPDAMFKNHVSLGDELTGIHFTRKKTEIDCITKVELVGISDNIKIEKGLNSNELMKTPWSPGCRHPDFSVLEVKGRAMKGPVCEIRIDGIQSEQSLNETDGKSFKLLQRKNIPSVLLNGNSYSWIDSEDSIVPPITQVCMIGHPGQKMTAHLTVKNDGQTAMFIDWVKELKKPDIFNLGLNRIQTLYMNARTCELLPGDSIHIPVFFCSAYPGIFTTVWKLMSRPLLCGGAPILVHLWGIAHPHDFNKEERENIEEMLVYRQSISIAKFIIDQVLLCVPVPVYCTYRPESALLRISERSNINTLFENSHTGWFYNSCSFNMIKQIAHQAIKILDAEEHPDRNYTFELGDIPDHWLYIPTIKQDINLVPSTNENKDTMLWKFNRAVTKMSFTMSPPVNFPFKYRFCYDLLMKVIEDIAVISFSIKSVMMKDYIDKTKTDTKTSKKKRHSNQAHADKSEASGGGKRSAPMKKKRKGQKDTKVVINEDVQNRYKHKMYTRVYHTMRTMIVSMETGLAALDADIPLIDRLLVDEATKAMFKRRETEL